MSDPIDGPPLRSPVAQMQADLVEALADLATATELLRRAGDAIAAYESEQAPSWEDDDVPGGIVADIGRFLAKRAGT